MKYFLFLVMTLGCGYVYGQHICGTSHSDQRQMTQDIVRYRSVPNYRSEKVYFPVTIHNIANDDGTGRLSAVKVLEQFQRLSEDFSRYGMVPYIKKMNFVDNTKAYSNAYSSYNILVSLKDKTSVNIFITNNASTPNGLGQTLGYYNRSGDYVVLRKLNTTYNDVTLTHELGHFFNLPHTFYGWEFSEDGYYDAKKHGNPVNTRYVPGTNYLLELMDGSNCANSADFICDTPPDYNFGFGNSQCNLGKIVRDYNGDTIKTMANNVMSYFDACKVFDFTEGQRQVMLKDFMSARRNYIRSAHVPDTSAIGSYDLITTASDIGVHYDDVYIDWEDAPGATGYAVFVVSGANSSSYIVQDSEIRLTDLRRNKTYLLQVKPFNEGNTRSEVKNFAFKTGRQSLSTFDDNTIESMIVYPNPVSREGRLTLHTTSLVDSEGQCYLKNLNGSILKSMDMHIYPGKTTHTVDIAGISSGIYILEMHTDYGLTYKKVVIE